MRVLTILIFVLAALTSCTNVDPCDGDSIMNQLADARPGDVVNIGACTISASVFVPPGVTLQGMGSSLSTIDALEFLALGAETQADLVTVVRGLMVVSSHGSVLVQGDGDVVFEDVILEVEAGTGLIANGTGHIDLRQVEVHGPISADNSRDERWLEQDAAQSVGIGLFHVAGATLSDVEVDGMARAGVYAENIDLEAVRLSVRNTLGHGVLIFGGTSSFEALEITDTHQGLRRDPSIAFVARDAAWTVDGFVIERSERYGIVAQGGAVAIDNLAAHDGGDVALWVGDATAVQLGGNNTIDEMRFAGVVLVDSQGVDIRNLSLSNVAVQTRVGAFGEFPFLELGDGLHLIGDLAGAHFENIDIRGAGRVGILLELIESEAPTFNSVQVDAPSSALGAVAGRSAGMPFELNIDVEPAWDAGITRDSDSHIRDLMLSGPLGVARAPSPVVLD